MHSVSHRASASFYVWVLSQKFRSDEVGRLASEVSRDKTFPKREKRLHFFLHYYSLEPDNRKAVKKAHAEWRMLRRKVAA